MPEPSQNRWRQSVGRDSVHRIHNAGQGENSKLVFQTGRLVIETTEPPYVSGCGTLSLHLVKKPLPHTLSRGERGVVRELIGLVGAVLRRPL